MQELVDLKNALIAAHKAIEESLVALEFMYEREQLYEEEIRRLEKLQEHAL
jgi:hypothetical protein